MKVIIFFLAVLFPTQAFAYFDPGTGSLLIQITVGAIAGIAVFWSKIKAAITSRFGRNQNQKDQTDERS
jgi:NhaP-type Na+/H+ or K+/H+ antiporter